MIVYEHRPGLPAMFCDPATQPDHRALDPIAGRERFYRQHIEPGRWLRVVVDFSEDPAWVVTAVVQDKGPRG